MIFIGIPLSLGGLLARSRHFVSLEVQLFADDKAQCPRIRCLLKDLGMMDFGPNFAVKEHRSQITPCDCSFPNFHGLSKFLPYREYCCSQCDKSTTHWNISISIGSLRRRFGRQHVFFDFGYINDHITYSTVLFSTLTLHSCVENLSVLES